jgi:hypothetical protein
MITFKINLPADLGEHIRRQLERSLANHLRKEGLTDVTVVIDEDGQARFSGPEESLRQVEAALQRWH